MAGAVVVGVVGPVAGARVMNHIPNPNAHVPNPILRLASDGDKDEVMERVGTFPMTMCCSRKLTDSWLATRRFALSKH